MGQVHFIMQLVKVSNCMQLHTRAHTDMCAHTHTDRHTKCIHGCMRAHIHICRQADRNKHTDIHMCAYVHMDECTHTDRHTCMT